MGDTGLVVKHLEVDKVNAELKPFHDVVVGCNVVMVVAGLEGHNQDHATVDGVHQHDVVVAATRADGEVAHGVGVELADGLDNNEKIIWSARPGADW